MSDALRTFAEWILDHTSPAEEAQPEPPPKPVRDCKHTVLAIDDDPMFLHTVTSVLRRHGFDVLTSTTGAKGLNMLAYGSGNIEVVLLDYSMPQLNGAETLVHLRKINPKIKVLALTAIDLNQVPKSFHDGVDGFIQKPFDARKVIAAIRSAVGTDTQPAMSMSSQH
jgi:DNA-binding response OmpR family regulator